MAESIQGTSVKRDYTVDDGPITLNIVIGDGQVGASVVWLNHQIIAKGDLDLVHLGDGNVLAGHDLAVRTIATDVNPQTKHAENDRMIVGQNNPDRNCARMIAPRFRKSRAPSVYQ